MSYDFDKRLLFFGIEATEGSEEALVAADAIVTRNLQPGTVETDQRQRQIDGQYFGGRPNVDVTRRIRTTFETELTGGGAATIVPPWMKLLQIAGFDGGTVGASDVTQALISSAIPSATLWNYTDSLRERQIACRSNVTFELQDDEYPIIRHETLGIPFTTLSDESAPVTPDVSAFQEPVLVNNDNTVFLLDGYAAPMRSFTLSAGNILTPRSLVGEADRIKYRNREFSGQIVLKCPTLAAKNYFTNMGGGIVPLSIVHGTAAGNIVTLSSSRCELGIATKSDEDGDLMLTLPIRLLPTTGTGNDEFSIVTS